MRTDNGAVRTAVLIKAIISTPKINSVSQRMLPGYASSPGVAAFD